MLCACHCHKCIIRETHEAVVGRGAPAVACLPTIMHFNRRRFDIARCSSMKVLWPAQGGIMQGPEAPSASFICCAVALSVVSAIVGLLVRLLL